MKLMKKVFSIIYQIMDTLKKLAELSSIGTTVSSLNRERPKTYPLCPSHDALGLFLTIKKIRDESQNFAL